MEQKSLKTVTYAELIGATVALISAGLIFWKTTDVRLSALELRMEMKEKTDETINSKLDKLQESINDVKITMQTKADKK